jgi:hypothetical protein
MEFVVGFYGKAVCKRDFWVFVWGVVGNIKGGFSDFLRIRD